MKEVNIAIVDDRYGEKMSETSWKIEFAASYIVPPLKGRNFNLLAPGIEGSQLQESEIPMIFRKLFIRSFNEYPTDIIFCSEGKKENPVRNHILNLVNGSNQSREGSSYELAKRLAANMDQKSETGLMVTICGTHESKSRIVIWKFPHDVIIRARSEKEALKLTQFDDAFSTKIGFVKAAIFEDELSEMAFWGGRVEDLESKSNLREAADLWIKGFLCSTSNLTSGGGSKELARIIRTSIDTSTSLEEKSIIITAYETLKNRGELEITINQFIDTYLPKELIPVHFEEISKREYANQEFTFDPQIAETIIGYETLILDSGFIINGPTSNIEELIRSTKNAESENSITLRGKVINRKLRAPKG